jgi:hypothetical protein
VQAVLAERFADLLLVLGVDEGEEKADGHGLDIEAP